MKLNDSQRKLVEQHEPFIHLFMSYYGLKFSSPEDWYGLIAEAMCVAALHYDKSDEPFSKFMIPYIKDAVGAQLIKNQEFIYGDVSLSDLR